MRRVGPAAGLGVSTALTFVQTLTRAAVIQSCHWLPTFVSSLLCQQFRRKPRDQEVRAVLIIRLDGLGDCVMTLPLLHQLRQGFPRAHLVVLTQPAAEPLFRCSGATDEVLVLRAPHLPLLPRQLGALIAAIQLYWRELRGRFFDIVISPRWDLDAFLATFLCGLTRAPITVGYEDNTSPGKLRWNSGFQRTWNILLDAGPLQHEVQRNLALGRALGCDAADRRPQLTIKPEQRRRAREWLGNAGDQVFVSVGLPAGHARRRWTAERYVATLRLLEQQLGIIPVLFADAPSSSLAETIMRQFPQSRLAKEVPLMLVAALLSECRIFIGSDSGLGHLAAAVDCPTVTLSPHAFDSAPSDPSNPVRFRPYSPRSIVIQPRAARQGCEAGCISNEPHCIVDISPKEVAEAVFHLLRHQHCPDSTSAVKRR